MTALPHVLEPVRHRRTIHAHRVVFNHGSSVVRVFRALAVVVRHEGISVDALLRALGEPALLLMSMALTAPFLVPASIPGSSVIVGVLLLVMGIGVVVGQTPPLPDRLLSHRLVGERWARLLVGTARIVRWMDARIDSGVRPLARVHGLSIAFGALLLLAPLPFPLTNFFPSWGAFLVALGLSKQRRRILWAGHAAMLLAAAYIVASSLLGVEGVHQLIGRL